MDMFERTYNDESSSFDEILDFELTYETSDTEDTFKMVEEEPYYRSLDDY